MNIFKSMILYFFEKYFLENFGNAFLLFFVQNKGWYGLKMDPKWSLDYPKIVLNGPPHPPHPQPRRQQKSPARGHLRKQQQVFDDCP